MPTLLICCTALVEFHCPHVIQMEEHSTNITCYIEPAVEIALIYWTVPTNDETDGDRNTTYSIELKSTDDWLITNEYEARLQQVRPPIHQRFLLA